MSETEITTTIIIIIVVVLTGGAALFWLGKSDSTAIAPVPVPVPVVVASTRPGKTVSGSVTPTTLPMGSPTTARPPEMKELLASPAPAPTEAGEQPTP